MTNQELQFYLNCLGFNAGAVDGVIGERTNRAKKQFFHKHNTGNSNAIAELAKSTLPAHLIRGAAMLGIKEIKGKFAHNSKIVAMFQAFKANIRDDETAWCSAFVRYCLATTIFASDLFDITLAARSWLNYSYPSDGFLGDICVFWRGNPKGWSGHVGFIVGRNENNDYYILGGNQGDSVSVALFPKSRVLSIRRYAKTSGAALDIPFITAKSSFSASEA
jgi:uncharacterized protein (TIGR02594 family)